MDEKLKVRLGKLDFKANVTLVVAVGILLALIFVTANITAKVEAMFIFVVKAIPLAGAL